MTRIKSFIDGLLKDSSYQQEKLDPNVYKHQVHHDYWMVVENFSLEDQLVLFEKLSEFRTKYKDFEKNVSILILNDCSSPNALNEDECILIENDPFYFKKNVLSYTPEVFEKFEALVANKNFLKCLFEDSFYDSFVKKYSGLNEYSLAYSIAQKLPFIATNVDNKAYECKSFYEQIDPNKKAFIDNIFALKNETMVKQFIEENIVVENENDF